MSAPDHGRLVDRLTDALRQVYGGRLLGTAWRLSDQLLVLDVELLGPVDVDAEKILMGQAIYDIVVEAGVTVLLNPVYGLPRRPPPDYRPEPQHVMRVATRIAEQIRIYHDDTWDFGDVDNRRAILARAREVAAFEDLIIADLLGREIKP